MDKLKELLAALAALDTKIDALLDNETLTAEQQTEHDTHVAEREKTTKKIAAEKKRLEREDERQKLEDDIATREQRPQRRSQPDTPNGDDVPAERDIAATRIPANVIRPSLRNFRGTRDGASADVRAYRFGLWGLAQLSIQMPARYRFNAALAFHEKVWGAAHQTNDASGVQNLMPHEFGQDLIVLRESYGLARRLLKNVTMLADTHTDPRQQGGLTANFAGEGQAASESNMAFDNVGLVAKDLIILTRMSNQVNAGAVINFGDLLMGEMSYACAFKEDMCVFVGDGTKTYGRIRGATNKLQDVDGNGTDSFGLRTASGNAYSEFVLKDFDLPIARLPQYADNERTCWVMHRSFYYEVAEPLASASGGVTATEIREGNRAPRPIFKGYPVEFSPTMPKSEANSQVVALLGDFYQGASFGDRQGLEIAFSEHATIGGENVFERNQIAVRGVERFDAVVHDVGSSTEAGPIVGLQTAAS